MIAGAAGLAVLGPIGYIIASWIASGVTLLNTYVSWLVPLILGGVFPLLVMTGTHYGIIPIGINNRMTTGFDTIVYPANLASNIAQGAATFAVAVKTKKDEVRQVASSAGILRLCAELRSLPFTESTCVLRHRLSPPASAAPAEACLWACSQLRIMAAALRD